MKISNILDSTAKCQTKIDVEMYDVFGIIVLSLWKGINCVSHRGTAYSIKLSMNWMKEVVLSGVKVYSAFRGQIFFLSPFIVPPVLLQTISTLMSLLIGL